MATVTVLQCAEIGKTLTFVPLAGTPSLLTTTITLLITPKGATLAKRYVCSLDATGTIPGRLTDGTEFPTPGSYTIQLEATSASPLERFYSPTSLVTALPNLG
jgi:hypothetical protein